MAIKTNPEVSSHGRKTGLQPVWGWGSCDLALIMRTGRVPALTDGDVSSLFILFFSVFFDSRAGLFREMPALSALLPCVWARPFHGASNTRLAKLVQNHQINLAKFSSMLVVDWEKYIEKPSLSICLRVSRCFISKSSSNTIHYTQFGLAII